MDKPVGCRHVPKGKAPAEIGEGLLPLAEQTLSLEWWQRTAISAVPANHLEVSTHQTGANGL